MRVLAIDIGSSAVKAGYWDGRQFAARTRAEFVTDYRGPQVEAPAKHILRALDRAVREAVGKAATVDVVAFCTFSSGVVVTDARGGIRAGAITHQDRRSVSEAQTLCESLGKKWLLAHTGNLPYPGGIGSSTLAWLRKHEPTLFRGDSRVGQLSSLIAWMLTGHWVIDPSQAVFLGLWDIRSKRWSEQVCDAVGVKIESLPRMVWADEVLGRFTRAAARRWGLREGTPVVGGLVDASAAVIQTPMHPGQLVHNAGSTDVLAMCMERPAPREGILSRPVGVGAGPFPQRWLAVRTIAASGSALDWAHHALFAELGDDAWYALLASACRRAVLVRSSGFSLSGRQPKGWTPNTESPLGPFCLPTFAGERAAIEQQMGATFSGITLATHREELLESLVRGLVNESIQSYRMLAAIHRPAPVVYATGGAGVLREAMHRAWPDRHRVRELNGDGLRGLVELAGRIL